MFRLAAVARGVHGVLAALGALTILCSGAAAQAPSGAAAGVPSPPGAAARTLITLVNAVPDVRALDLFVDGKKLHAGVNYRGHNGPDAIPAGPCVLSVRTNEDKVVLPPTPITLEAGRSYTVYSTGALAAGVETSVVETATGSVVGLFGGAKGGSAIPNAKPASADSATSARKK